MTHSAGTRLQSMQIWNMCFGFLGLQFGLGLQNANVSRIFQTLGAGIDQIPALWIAAPLTGLIVQPLVGYLSDHTWTGMGRRRPYLLIGAFLSSAALLFMPLSPMLWIAAVLLWLLDASINTSMQPFRALVGDLLPTEQRTTGFAVQSFFIGVGAVVASMLPWLFEKMGVSNTAPAGIVPETVHLSFFCGAAVLFLTVLWTVLFTREYPPEELFREDDAAPAAAPAVFDPARHRKHGLMWAIIGALCIGLIFHYRLDKQLYIISAGAFLWGLAQLMQKSGAPKGFISTILRNIETMPDVMRALAPVQFFSWLAFYALWIYTTSAVAETCFGATDPTSAAYNAGANWVGVLFAAYNGFAALMAIFIPAMARRLGVRMTHLINLWLGGIGLLSFLFIRNPDLLLISMIGVGIAWASVLSLPYALLSDSLPAREMGVYMGIFNFFIVIPQLVAASVLGFCIRVFFAGLPLHALTIGGGSFLIAGVLTLRLPKGGAA